jgi:hypothetical protein
VSVDIMIHVGTTASSLMGFLLRPRRSIRSFRARAVFLWFVTRLPALAAAVLTAAFAAPAAAQAATWTQAPGACYVSAGEDPVNRQAVRIAASGFTPGARVDVIVDGAPADADGDGAPDAVMADLAGAVVGAVRAPHQPRGERSFTVTLSEHDIPANTVTATTRVTALHVGLRPKVAPPSSRVRFTGRGFVAGRKVWAHYVYRGKVRKTVRLAQSRGRCGTFTVRRRQVPITRPRTGEWTLQIDQQRAYAPAPETPVVWLLITIRPVIR